MTDVGKIVLDKVLLAASGVIISLVTAWWVERHRRNEAITLELGKVKANALTGLIAASRELEFLLTSLADATHEERQSRDLVEKGQRLEAVRSEFAQLGVRNLALLDKELRSEAMAYIHAIGDF